MNAIRSLTNQLTEPLFDPDTRLDLPRYERPVVIAILSAFLLLTIAFSLGPISESPDEYAHYYFMRFLIQNHTLPDPVTRPFIQAHQAPLYYVAGIPFLLVLDSDQVVPPIKNPWGGYKLDALGNDNKNIRLHSAAEDFPYTASPIALAIHVTRLLSILMGLGTVIASYFIFRLLWPANPPLRLAALGFVAFWPQFVWLSSVLNNDNALNLLSTVTLLVVLTFQRRGLTTRSAILLGGVFGLALLAKASAVFLAIPIGVALLMDLKRWRYALIAIGLALVLAAWWYVRNMLTIHTLSGWPDGPQYGGLEPGQSLLAVAWDRLPFVYDGFWARFGQVDIPVSPLMYRFFDVLLIVSLVGLVIWLVRMFRRVDWARWNTTHNRDFLIMASFGLAWIAGVVYSAGVVSQGNQGRYMQPGIAAWAAILALGTAALIPERFRLRAALAEASVMAGVTAVCLFGFFYPAFRPLPVPAHVDRPLDIRFGDSARLIGMSPAQPHGHPGDTITISLYWQALAPTTGNLAVYLHSVDSPAVQRDSFPATGNLRSIDWLPGQTWQERYVITIPNKKAAPQTVSDLMVGLYHYDENSPDKVGDELPAFDSSGAPVRAIVGRIAINGPSEPFTPDYSFGGVIGLAKPAVTRQADRVETCLKWLSIAPAPQDYQMFVHVLGPDGTMAAQSDFQPKAGQYPTGAWSPGEVITQCVPLDAPGLPASGWRVAVGLYDLATGARPSVVDHSGVPQPENQVVVTP